MVNTRGTSKQVGDTETTPTHATGGATVFSQPPQSPSETAIPSASANVAKRDRRPSDTPNDTQRATATTSTAPAAFLTANQRAPSSVHSVRTSASTTRRRREAELAAAERLAAIESKRLQQEEELVRKQLELRMAELDEEEEEETGNITAIPTDQAELRIERWLQETEPTNHGRHNGEQARHHASVIEREEPPSAAPDRPSGVGAHRRPPTNDRGESPKSDIALLAAEIAKLAGRPAERAVTDLPAFSGAATDWLSFKAAYDESRTRLSTSECVSRLRRSLRGDAKEAVAPQLITHANPDDVMQTLERRFGRPELIVAQELRALRDLPRLTENGTAQLHVFACRVQNTVAALRALGREQQLHSFELAQCLKSKMAHLQGRWLDYAVDHENSPLPEIIKISEFLSRESDRISRHWAVDASTAPARAALPTPPLANARAAANNATTRGGHKTKHQVLAATEVSAVECVCCNTSGHALAKCKKFMDAPVEERWRLVKEARVCFRCLGAKHGTRTCKERSKCKIEGCGRSFHHTLLHDEQWAAKQSSSEQAVRTEQEGTSASGEHREPHVVLHAASDDDGPRTLLKFLPVTVHGPRRSQRTFAMLDDGSMLTLLRADIADSIGASGPRRPLALGGLLSSCVVGRSRRVNITVSGASTDRHELRGVRTVERLPKRTQPIDPREYPHLRDLPLEACAEEEVGLLIGQDFWELLERTEIRIGEHDQPVASLTELGWALHGRIGTRTGAHSVNFVGHVSEHEQTADRELRAFFDLESLGVSTKKRTHPQDERALRILERTCHRTEDGRWEAGLLWKEDEPKMPPSRDAAARRLRAIERKMDKDRVYGEAYAAQIDKLIERGYAVACTKSDSPHEWYLPHFAVTNPNKPGKMRVVFDAAATINMTSLNDKLLTGPDLLQSLLGVLFRFREGKYAVTADIREMFLRIKMRAEDRHAQRFLWRGWERSAPPQEFEMASVMFGAASSPTTAIYVKNRNAQEYAKEHPEAVAAVTHNHYMDDYLDSYGDEATAARVASDVKTIHARGGFELTGWASNSKRVMAAVNAETPGEERSLNLSEAQEKTLGLRWNPHDDTLGFNLTMARVNPEVVSGNQVPTKRETLSVVMSMFDPLGLLAPIIVQAKVLLQEIWRSGVGWDEPLAEKEAKRWQEWLNKLRASWACREPRHYGLDDEVSEVQLHTFVDASEAAYAAVSYLRIERRDGSTHTAFVASKSRVAPLRPTSIPRLELQGALLGARLAATIKKEHRFAPTSQYFWSDSRTVLAWLKNDARNYKPFVSHRLSELDELTDRDEWRWVPTKENVADDATRELEVLTPGHRWFTGPSFLLEHSSRWPRVTEIAAPSEIDPELKIACFAAVYTATTPGQDALPDVHRFSSWLRLIRTTALVLLFTEKVQRKGVDRLQQRHYQRAEELWQKHVQQECYAPDLRRLRAGASVERDSKLAELAPSLDAAGVIRLRGRTGLAAQVRSATKNPVILDGKHPYTRLLVHHHHVMALHANQETVVNSLRTRFWILRVRPTVRAVARSCQTCRLRRATTQLPPAGDLPAARLGHHQRPFSHCGLDYFGPLLVTIGRRHEKRYCALFTCMVTRAVHTEVVASLTTDSAISALRRMSARRGPPAVIYSDNGTNFHGADAELRRAWAEIDQEAVRTYALNKGAEWRFNPPASPHMGGCWERLVRSIKNALHATLKDRAPHEEVLCTLLAEAEMVVNSRPLTHVPVSHEDDEALTPNHFLLGSASGAPTLGAFDDCDLARRRQWRATQRLADIFWARWVREYLPTLLPRPHQGDGKSDLQPGDLVIVVDANLPRNVWPRGVIDAVYPGRDGRVRVADVRTTGGVLRRPARKIIRLPVQRVVDHDAETTRGGAC